MFYLHVPSLAPLVPGGNPDTHFCLIPAPETSTATSHQSRLHHMPEQMLLAKSQGFLLALAFTFSLKIVVSDLYVS